MFEPKQLFGWLSDAGVSFFTGVPDSLLKDFCAYVTDNAEPSRHVITANEGGAIALAMGHHLATGDLALVYMQNSGLGNAVNPLTSLVDPAVYGIPMLLIVGWRGMPGVKDEPQHARMGRVTRETLEAISVPHTVLSEEADAAKAEVEAAADDARKRLGAHALVVRKGTFSKYKLASDVEQPYPLSREQVIGAIVETLPPQTIIVSTTGKPSRELYEIREARGDQHRSDLLTVGGMGHASHIALGIAINKPERSVYCFDGDGAAIMHMGGLAIIASLAARNYKHIVLNNGAHDSVGGQPTVAHAIDLRAIAQACGYRSAERVDDATSLPGALTRLASADGPAFLEIRMKKGGRNDLGRPKMTPAELKQVFMQYVAGE